MAARPTPASRSTRRYSFQWYSLAALAVVLGLVFSFRKQSVSLLRNKLALGCGLVCAAPLVLGTAAYLLGWSPGAPSNYGELIPPRPRCVR